MKKYFNKKTLSIVLVLALVAGLFGGYAISKSNKSSASSKEASINQSLLLREIECIILILRCWHKQETMKL